MRSSCVILVLFASVLLATPGCASENASGETPSDESDIDDVDGKADGVSKPTGTYYLSKPSAPRADDFSLLVLKTDTSFYHDTYQWLTEGVYKFTKSPTSSKRYIRFDNGRKVRRYEYKLGYGGKLSLRLDGTTPWFEMKHSDKGWCYDYSDCGLQNLPAPRCPIEWLCEESTCSHSECQSPSSEDCESADGQCVALAPENCTDGIIGEPESYSCPITGMMCCLPKPEAPTCEEVGTVEEGWYYSDGSKICAADCAGTKAKCASIGTQSEGWYAPPYQGCAGGSLIGEDNCG